MYRTSINRLIQWKLDENKKPLVFLGARQGGKTYLVQEFGKQEYRPVVCINFERAEKMKSVFLQDLDPKRLITNFEFYSGLKITPEESFPVGKVDIHSTMDDMNLTLSLKTKMANLFP